MNRKQYYFLFNINLAKIECKVLPLGFLPTVSA